MLLTPTSPAGAIDLPFVGNPFGSSDDSAERRGGGKEWWRRHKSKAEFVPGEGYRVPGYAGFYDGEGVPIDAAVDQRSIRLDASDADEPGGLLPGLDPKRAAKRVREAAGYGPDEQAARGLLAEGVRLFEEGKHGAAAKRFRSAADRWPGSNLAAKALFNLGEALFFADNYDDASDAYIELLEKHPSTPRLDAAVERMWEIAQFWERTHFGESWRPPFDYQPFNQARPTFDTVGHALRLYESIRLNDPTGPRADDAIMATAGVHFRRNQFADADYHYRLLREEYPRSEHQFEAHLLGLQALMNRYQGPDYDGSTLRKAEKLEEQTRLNFSGRLTDEERQRLRDVRAKIAAEVEQRSLRMAEYFEGIGRVGSTKYYLSRISERHADSPVADTARERLADLEGLPDQPPTRLGWLVDLVPENKRFESINSIEEINAAARAERVAAAPGDEPPTATR